MFAIVKKSRSSYLQTYAACFLHLVDGMYCVKKCMYVNYRKKRLKLQRAILQNETNRCTALIYTQLIKQLWLICKQTIFYQQKKVTSNYHIPRDLIHSSPVSQDI